MSEKCEMCGADTPYGTVNYNGAELYSSCYAHVRVGESYVIAGEGLADALKYIRETEEGTANDKKTD